KQADLKALFDVLSPGNKEVVLALCNVVHRTVPQAEESVLWGSFSYHRPQVGGRVKGAVCQIVVKHGHVRLDSIHGVRLADPCGFGSRGIGCRTGLSQSKRLATPSVLRLQP